jgi:hypothetical protein
MVRRSETFYRYQTRTLAGEGPGTTMDNFILVSIADAGYYPLLCDLIGSVRVQTWPLNVRIGVVDVGLTQAQISELNAFDIAVVPARWNFAGEMPTGLPIATMAMLSKPFLRDYFPGHEFYVYLDADTWIQGRETVTDLVQAAYDVDIAAAPELHCAYPHLYSIDNGVKNLYRDAFKKVYGDAASPADTAVFNGGVFAARHDSSLWLVWRSVLAEAVKIRGVPGPVGGPSILAEPTMSNYFIEQNALNVAIYRAGIKVRCLSPLYNWICTLALPFYDPLQAVFVEPSPPYAPIRIVHLTGVGRDVTQVPDRYGLSHEVGLVWPGQSLSWPNQSRAR